MRRNWFAQRELDDGCTLAASRLIGEPGPAPHDAPTTPGSKARLAIEANRPRAAARRGARSWRRRRSPCSTELNNSPAKYLTGRVVVASQVAQGD